MRLVTYQGSDGQSRLAAVVRSDGGIDEVVDLAAASDGRLPGSMLDLLAAGPGALRDVAVAVARAPERTRTPLIAVRLMAPLPRPQKLLAAAMNYQSHIVQDVGREPFDRTRTVPKLFLKPVTAVMGPDDELHLPDFSKTVDWEAELGCVIGVGGHNIAPEEALAHVAGYLIVNDISARSMDWGLPDRAATHWDGFFDWLAGKWADGFAPMGPWLLTADEVPDPQALSIRLSVNGEIRQDGSTAEMMFGVAELVAFASRIMTLQPGDIIATGTPAGVGSATGQFLKPGDVMEATIDGLGLLRTRVALAPGDDRAAGA